MPTNPPLVPSQDARDAAASMSMAVEWKPSIIAGMRDSTPMVQAFAAFERRIREDQAETICKFIEGSWVLESSQKSRLCTLIRAQIKEQG